MVQNNVLYAFVAKKAQVGATSATIANDLASQEVAICGADGEIITSITGKKDLRWVRRNPLSGKLEYSFFWDAADLVKSNVTVVTAATQFTGYLGYNGTSGAFDAAASTVYTPQLVIKDALTTFGNKNMMKQGVFKTAAGTPLNSDLAIGLATSFYWNMLREPEQYVRVSPITSATGTEVTTTGTDAAFTFTEGSDIVTAAGTNLAAHGLVVGSVIQTDNGNIYKVAGVTLSGTTGTINLTYAAVVTEATAEGATGLIDLSADLANGDGDWGLKFVGKARLNFSAGTWRYLVYNFDILPGENFADDGVDVTYTTKGAKGINTYEDVTETEWFAQGNRGYGDRWDFPIAPLTQVTTENTGAAYSSLDCSYKLSQFTNLVGQSPASLATVKIYGVDSLIDILDGYL